MTSIGADAMTGKSMLRDVFPPHTYDQWREAVMSILLAGGDVLIMRHPEAIKLIRDMIARLTAS